jgi:hypothetical protein
MMLAGVPQWQPITALAHDRVWGRVHGLPQSRKCAAGHPPPHGNTLLAAESYSICTILYLVCVEVAILLCWGGGELVLFAGLAAGLLAGVSTQFIQCGEHRSAVKVTTCNTPPKNQESGVSSRR